MLLFVVVVVVKTLFKDENQSDRYTNVCAVKAALASASQNPPENVCLNCWFIFFNLKCRFRSLTTLKLKTTTKVISTNRASMWHKEI